MSKGSVHKYTPSVYRDDLVKRAMALSGEGTFSGACDAAFAAYVKPPARDVRVPDGAVATLAQTVTVSGVAICKRPAALRKDGVCGGPIVEHESPTSPTEMLCDVCGEAPKPTDGERLRQARERNNMSQRALAFTLGDDTHSHQRVGRMERGGEELSAEARAWLETVGGGEVAQ